MYRGPPGPEPAGGSSSGSVRWNRELPPPEAHPGLNLPAPPPSPHCAHYAPHWAKHRQTHVKSSPNCNTGLCVAELDDRRFQEWTGDAVARLTSLNWSLAEWKWARATHHALLSNNLLRKTTHVDAFPTGMRAKRDWEDHMASLDFDTRRSSAIQVTRRLIRDWFTEDELALPGFQIDVDVQMTSNNRSSNHSSNTGSSNYSSNTGASNYSSNSNNYSSSNNYYPRRR